MPEIQMRILKKDHLASFKLYFKQHKLDKQLEIILVVSENVNPGWKDR